MRPILLFLLLLPGLKRPAFAQTPAAAPRPPEAFGYRRLTVLFGRDSVQVLLLSKPGEETQKKPLLLWEQGSIPTPLVLYDERGAFAAFPFMKWRRESRPCSSPRSFAPPLVESNPPRKNS